MRGRARGRTYMCEGKGEGHTRVRARGREKSRTWVRPKARSGAGSEMNDKSIRPTIGGTHTNIHAHTHMRTYT